MLDVNEIMDIIPHRYPFLLVDRVLEVEGDKRVVGIKNVSMNEPFFQGHFPGLPVMPGVLMVEALAQLAGVILLSKPETKGKVAFFASVDKVKFRKPVVPGDQLRLEVDITKLRGVIAKARGIVYVEGKVVAEALMTFSMMDSGVESKIDATAMIHPSAIIGKDVVVGPHAYIGENVKLGNGVIVEANVVIEKWTSIGKDSHIHYGAIIGNSTQDKKYLGEKSYVEIGERNDIREYVTINRATSKGGKTIIGDDNLFLTNVHIGHDCVLGNKIVISNAAQIAGHVEIEDRVIVGGMAGITQFCRIGEMAMVGGYSKVNQDVPPYMLIEGNPAVIRTLNSIGVERNGVPKNGQKALKDAYKTLFRSSLNMGQALIEIKAVKENTDQVQHLVDFIEAESKNGIMKKEAKKKQTV